jgi:hypothetical protein
VVASAGDIAERGHVGGSSLNPSVQEARQGRTALGRLLSGIDLPESGSFTELRALRAGTARWQREKAS